MMLRMSVLLRIPLTIPATYGTTRVCLDWVMLNNVISILQFLWPLSIYFHSTINLTVFFGPATASYCLTSYNIIIIHVDAVIYSPVQFLISPIWVDRVASQQSSVACEFAQTGTVAGNPSTALHHVPTRHGYYWTKLYTQNSSLHHMLFS